MKWYDWFKELDIEDDIEEIHSLYRTLVDRTDSYGYDLKCMAGKLVINQVCELTDAEIHNFVDYLDSLPICGGLQVEGARELHRAIEKDD